MRRPVVVGTALFAAGIVLEGALSFGVVPWMVLAGGAGLLLPRTRLAGPGPAAVYGLTAALVLAAAGGWWHARHRSALDDGLDEYIDGDPVSITGVVVELPEVGSDRTYYVVRLTGLAPSVAGETREGLPFRGRPRLRLTVVGPRRFSYGDVLEARLVLERPAPASNPGAFDYKEYLHRQGITATAFVRYPRHVTAVGRRWLNPVVGWAGAARDWIVAGLYGALPDDAARLAAGVALGDRRGMAPEVEEAFRRAGISHLLAVSGMHVGFVAAAAAALIKLLRIPRGPGTLLAAGLLWSYVLITGGRPPAVRAAVGGTVALAALQRGQRVDGATVLAAAAFCLMLQNPLVLYDVSFQLSFAAAGAIAAGFQPLQSALRRRRLPKAAASAVAVAVCAQWGVLPLVARTFHEVSSVGLAAGLLAAPLVAGLVPAAVATALLHPVWPWAARAPATFVLWGAGVLEGLSRSFSALPWATVVVPKPSFLLVGAIWMLGLLLLRGGEMPPRRRRRGWAFTAALLLVNLWSGFVKPTPGVELVAIDVGQGDALFIRTSSGATALVDGGGVFQPPDAERVPDTGLDIVIPYLRYRGISRIDLVINTHPHEDHLQGLLPVLEQFPVGMAVDGGYPGGTPSWAAYEALVSRRNIPRHIARPGDVFRLDEKTHIEVLHPGRVPMEGTRSDPNNNSVVLRLVHADTAALLTGDIETEAQLALLRGRADVRADVVKVPHHGSRHGLVTAFYEAIGPELAVIPVGRNSHGHPSPELIDVLHRMGAAVYRTDVHGAVTFTSDGRSWNVRTVLGRER